MTPASAATVLVVEDDDALREYFVEALVELGYHVLSAATGAAALEILERAAVVDLLFTDVVMPGGMNGHQLADEATRRRPGLEVLFTTGYGHGPHDRRDADPRMIGKPFTLTDLGAKVRALLDR